MEGRNCGSVVYSLIFPLYCSSICCANKCVVPMANARQKGMM